MPDTLPSLWLAALAALGAGSLAAQASSPAASPRYPTTVEMPAPVETGAPSPDSLVHLVLARFATGTPDAFDSVYPDPLGRVVVAGAAQRKMLRTPGVGRVVWSDASRAVMLITGTVHEGHATGIETGSDETNRVRRFSGFYGARKNGGVWMLTRQIPFDTLNYIRAQVLHVDIEPGGRHAHDRCRESVRLCDAPQQRHGAARGPAQRQGRGSLVRRRRAVGRYARPHTGRPVATGADVLDSRAARRQARDGRLDQCDPGDVARHDARLRRHEQHRRLAPVLQLRQRERLQPAHGHGHHPRAVSADDVGPANGKRQGRRADGARHEHS